MYKSTYSRTPSSPQHLSRQNILNRYNAQNAAKSADSFYVAGHTNLNFSAPRQFSRLRSISGVSFSADRSVEEKTVVGAHFTCYKSIKYFITLGTIQCQT
jgi:hypothetical protein